MRLSCNFVHVYTIVYHMYTYTCKRAHPHQTSSRGKAHADSGQKSGRQQVARRAERAASAAERPAAAHARHADFLARILARKSARKSVSVSVLWNLANIARKSACPARAEVGAPRLSACRGARAARSARRLVKSADFCPTRAFPREDVRWDARV